MLPIHGIMAKGESSCTTELPWVQCCSLAAGKTMDLSACPRKTGLANGVPSYISFRRKLFYLNDLNATTSSYHLPIMCFHLMR